LAKMLTVNGSLTTLKLYGDLICDRGAAALAGYSMTQTVCWAFARRREGGRDGGRTEEGVRREGGREGSVYENRGLWRNPLLLFKISKNLKKS
jgi:hypothetical protein